MIHFLVGLILIIAALWAVGVFCHDAEGNIRPGRVVVVCLAVIILILAAL